MYNDLFYRPVMQQNISDILLKPNSEINMPELFELNYPNNDNFCRVNVLENPSLDIVENYFQWVGPEIL